MRNARCALALLTLFAAAGPAAGQRIPLDSIATADTSVRHEARLKDGSRLVGRIIAVTADSVRIELRSGVMTVARSGIAETRQFPSSSLHDGEYWAENPNPTRLLFSATAYPLERGEGYYWNAWLFLHGFAVGASDRFTIGGGFSLVPGVDFGDNFFFVTPKLTLTRGTGPQVAIGALAGFIPGVGPDDEGESLGILYGVSSFGSRERNFSAGLGWGYVGGEIASKPIVMLGGQTRLSRRVALISENWFVPVDDDFPGLLSYGFRFLGEKLSVDLAFVNATEEMIFPGIPWIGFAVKF